MNAVLPYQEYRPLVTRKPNRVRPIFDLSKKPSEVFASIWRKGKKADTKAREFVSPPKLPPKGWWDDLTAPERRRLSHAARGEALTWWTKSLKSPDYREYIAGFFPSVIVDILAPPPRRQHYPTKLRQRRWWEWMLGDTSFLDYLERHFGFEEALVILTEMAPRQHAPREINLPEKKAVQPQATRAATFVPSPLVETEEVAKKTRNRQITYEKDRRHRKLNAVKRWKAEGFPKDDIPVILTGKPPRIQISAAASDAQKQAAINEAFNMEKPMKTLNSLSTHAEETAISAM